MLAGGAPHVDRGGGGTLAGLGRGRWAIGFGGVGREGLEGRTMGC